MNTSSFGVEKATLIRVPAIANLFIDSSDRDYSVNESPYDFQIYRRQALINGYFSRIGATEVVLDWCEYNVPTTWSSIPDVSMNKIRLDISGTGANTYQSPPGGTGFEIPPGIYTIGDVLEIIAATISQSSGVTGVTASVSTTTYPGWTTLDLSGGVASFINPYINLEPYQANAYLGTRLGFSTFQGEPSSVFILDCPDLRLTKYLDIVCENLTAVQDAQDATSAATDRNVIVRWYMAEDNVENEDQYGFPILMGYRQFHRRRLFNPPKQIKWEQNTQIGNLTFRCFDDQGRLMVPTEEDPRSQVAMTLQLSEG